MGLAERVVYQAEKRVREGKRLAASQKVFSIFEEHTELIIGGKANKPVEFGHKVVLGQTEGKFITHYEVLHPKREDRTLVGSILNAHVEMFGGLPKSVSLDEGFYESADQLKSLKAQIAVVSIRKKDKRTDEEKACEANKEFNAGQRFRAGIEGCISVLSGSFHKFGNVFFHVAF